MEKSMDLGVVYAKASLLFVFLSMAMMAISVSSSASEPEGECTDALMEISPCLPYISSSPNNLSSSVSKLCCESFAVASESGNATCLCYLLHHPFTFGFPLNATRISSLFFVCPLGNDTNPGTTSPLDSLCEVSENSPSAMPSLAPAPVPSISASHRPSLASAPVPSISASHRPSVQQNPDETSPIPMSPSADMGSDSSTSESASSSRSCNFLPGIIMLFSIHIVLHLVH